MEKTKPEERFMVRHLDEAMQFANENVYSEALLASEPLNCSLFCLKHGIAIDRRVFQGDACLQILRGRATVEVGNDGEKVDVREGSFIFIPTNTAHSVHAQEDTAFLVCESKPYY